MWYVPEPIAYDMIEILIREDLTLQDNTKFIITNPLAMKKLVKQAIGVSSASYQIKNVRNIVREAVEDMLVGIIPHEVIYK